MRWKSAMGGEGGRSADERRGQAESNALSLSLTEDQHGPARPDTTAGHYGRAGPGPAGHYGRARPGPLPGHLETGVGGHAVATEDGEDDAGGRGRGGAGEGHLGGHDDEGAPAVVDGGGGGWGSSAAVEFNGCCFSLVSSLIDLLIDPGGG